MDCWLTKNGKGWVCARFHLTFVLLESNSASVAVKQCSSATVLITFLENDFQALQSRWVSPSDGSGNRTDHHPTKSGWPPLIQRIFQRIRLFHLPRRLRLHHPGPWPCHRDLIPARLRFHRGSVHHGCIRQGYPIRWAPFRWATNSQKTLSRVKCYWFLQVRQLNINSIY